MSRDSHPGLRCPHCQTALTLVPAAGSQTTTVPSPTPFALIREEASPPPIAEVLAPYAGRVKDTTTALRGAAKVRASLDRARQAGSQRRTTQKAARRAFRSA
ncbi:hypothetical protein F8566_16710 [Actinomadura rudentiformis]|uniref:Uncharacterized protein n=1 Tax=Actinomadura rudentiformis TaxID=359158 RepID=A0A6H9YPZ5_9ACTN|nr:hypothetical protein F8566_16710 [Actinomadura rudentiformis]